MTAHILDTHCLVTFVTDRNPPLRKRISDILERAASLDEDLCVIANVISEFVYVLTLPSGRFRRRHDSGRCRETRPFRLYG